MTQLTSRKKIHRFHENGKVEALEDHLINEFRLTIHLDGKELVQAIISPYLIDEFVLGFLVTRGIIEGPGDLSSLVIKGNDAFVERNQSHKGTMPQLRLLETTGTKNIDLSQSVALTDKLVSLKQKFPVKILIDGISQLSNMPLHNQTGGTHCTILFSHKGELIVNSEDIGRHNSVDKVIGAGLMKDLNFGKCWLAVSGRLPADMVLKPILTGIPLIASVSAPTSEGVRMSERAGLTLVGFTRGGRLNCYCHCERMT
jgi:FdhD protein